eukprot:493771_1
MGNALSKEQSASGSFEKRAVLMGFDETKHICPYMQRIDKILNICHQMETEDIYDFVCKQYANNNDINGFVNDYDNYVTNIDNNNIYTKTATSCDIASCEIIKREYRNKLIYDFNNSERFKLYKQCKSEYSIIIQQLLDQLHIAKYHLVDLGLRYVPELKNDDENDAANVNNINVDKKLGQMRNDLRVKRQYFNKIRNDNKDSNAEHNTCSKFVTEFYENKNDDAKNEYPQYSLGIRFYYHLCYKNNENSHWTVPGSSGLHEGSSHLAAPTFAELFVTPKHKTIKQEVLNANPVKLSIIQYCNTLKKATLKHKSLSLNAERAKFFWQDVYGIKAQSVITSNHIFAVMLYTNHTQLSFYFSKSFRPCIETDTIASMKNRHSEYGNWAKTLRETVETYGTILSSLSSIKSFYHGISRKMLFPGGFDGTFCCPTSTTLNYSTAVMFASQGDNGIVITIKNNDAILSFFNCISWSDYPGESEMLFIGGLNPATICGLYSVSDSIKYDRWIQPFQIAISVLRSGENGAFEHKITQTQVNLVESLISDVVNTENNIESKDNIETVPKYVQQLFHNVINGVSRIIININMFNKEHIIAIHNSKVTILYGYQLFKHWYFDDKNQIRFDIIKALFPSLIEIHIRNTEYDEHGKWLGSVFIDDTLMMNILSYLTNSKNEQCIAVRYPLNTIHSLNKIVDRYNLLFSKIEYKLSFGKSLHPENGCCITFSIVTKKAFAEMKDTMYVPTSGKMYFDGGGYIEFG